jgi:hypothetical protein
MCTQVTWFTLDCRLIVFDCRVQILEVDVSRSSLVQDIRFLVGFEIRAIQDVLRGEFGVYQP